MAIELLAAAAITMIAPYLAKAGEAAAEKAGEGAAEAAGKVLSWLRAKLSGEAREALERVEGNPASEGRKAVFKEELAKALEADPGLAEELRALIPEDALQRVTMNQTIGGDNVKAAQVQGSGNDVKIG